MGSFTAGTSYRKYNEKKNCHYIDASGLVLGRLASEIAKLLRGKNKADFTPHLDSGDMVIVVNAEKIAITGKKKDQDVFYWHTGHPGGIKSRTKGEILDGRFPERVLTKAVERMMPKDSPLARKQMKSLHIYAGPEHKHQAQNPVTLDFGAKNRKNQK
jgi:large subunit ribosomal protein L13